MTAMSRRTAIGAVAAMAAAIPSTLAAGEPDAALLSLAAQIVAIRTAWDERAAAHYALHPNDLHYDICDQPEADLVSALEDQITAIRPTTLKGFCVRFLIESSFGDFNTSDELADAAIALSGFLPEPSHPRHPDYRRKA